MKLVLTCSCNLTLINGYKDNGSRLMRHALEGLYFEEQLDQFAFTHTHRGSSDFVRGQ